MPVTNYCFVETLRLALDNFEQKNQHIKDINDYCRKCLQEIEGIVINSDENCCLPSILNFSCLGYNQKLFYMIWKQKKYIYQRVVLVHQKRAMFHESWRNYI